MSQLLVVFGATGQQGGSVIDFVLKDQKLRSAYRMRGITRDVSKQESQTLQQRGVEVVAYNGDDDASVQAAVKGAHTVFVMVRSIYDEQMKARELRQTRAIVDAAVAAGAKMLIYSTAVHCGRISRGKYPVAAYDSKAEMEDYIRTLPIASAFYAPGVFMQNFAGSMLPRQVEGGAFEIYNVHSPDTMYPLIDITADTGKYVGTILSDPLVYAGRVLSGAAEIVPISEVARRLSVATGKSISYKQIPESTYRAFLPAAAADNVVNMFLFMQDYGHFGEREAERVWDSNNLVGLKMTTLEAYVETNPLKLD